MGELLDPSELQRRMELYVCDEESAERLPKRSSTVLREALLAGELKRGRIPQLIDTSERTARRVISALIDKRLLVSVSHKAPLRPGFPIDVVEREEFINAGVILSCPKLGLLGARIEAAMNNGTATPDMVPEDVRRAQEESARREIAAQTQLAPPPALSKDPPSRAEARAALVDDFMSLATDGLAACQPLRSGTPDPVDFKSGASRDEIAELLAVKRSEFATGCTQSGDGDAPAEAYFKRQRDSVRRVVPPS